MAATPSLVGFSFVMTNPFAVPSPSDTAQRRRVGTRSEAASCRPRGNDDAKEEDVLR